MKYEEPGVGVRITRLGKDGEIEHLDRLKPEYYQRIEMLGKLNDRRESLKTAGDWAGLIVLADEYEEKFMPTVESAPAVPTATATMTVYGVCADVLNVRVDHDTTAKVVRTLGRMDIVTVLEWMPDGWARIGEKEYVNGDWLCQP